MTRKNIHILRYLFLVAMMLTGWGATAQSWNMQDHDTLMIDGCQYSSGTIYDNGGQTGYYSNNFDGWVIIEANVGANIHITGNYNTESGNDFLNIWDNDSLVRERASGTGSVNVYCPSGRAVIRFTSNASNTRSGFSLSFSITGGASAANRINNLTVSSITATAATLQWTSGSGGPFRVLCDNPADGGISTSATTYTLTGLNPSQRHTVTVYPEGMADNRCAQGTLRFRTLCGTGWLPLVEDFNDVTTDQMPPCWTRSVNFDDAMAMPRVVDFDNGEKALMLSCGSNNTGGHFGMVVGPTIASDASQWHVQFRMMVSHPNTKVIVGFCDSTSDEQSSYGFVQMEVLSPSSYGWITYNKSYTVPAGGCRLAFRMQQSAQNGVGRMAYIDDLNIRSCGIVNARAVHPDVSGFDLMWDTLGSPDVTVRIRPSWGTGTELTLEHVTSPLTVSGLDPGTNYQVTFYISCGGEPQGSTSIEAHTLSDSDYEDDLCLYFKHWNSSAGAYELAEGWSTACLSGNGSTLNDDVLRLANNCFLISPPLNQPGGKELMIEYYCPNAGTDRLVVGTMTYPDDLTTFTPLDTLHTDGGSYFRDTVLRLPAGLTDQYLAFKGMCYGSGTANLRSLSLNAGHVVGGRVVKVKSTSVTLQWESPTTGKVYIDYHAVGNGVHYLDSVVGDTVAVITGLSPEHTYNFHFYLPGTELCEAVGEITVATARRDYDQPYCEDFEDFHINEPYGWSIRTSLFNCPSLSVEYRHSGAYSLKLSATTGYYSAVSLPQIDEVGGSIISFWAYTLAPASSVVVGWYSPSGTAFYPIDTIAIMGNRGWKHYVCRVPTNVDGKLALKYMLTGCDGTYYVWIDDMSLGLANYSDYTFANLGCTSVDVVWHGVGVTDSLTVKMGRHGTHDTVITTGVPDTIHVVGLANRSIYDCYILPHGGCEVYAGQFTTMDCDNNHGGGGPNSGDSLGVIDSILNSLACEPLRCNTMDNLLSYELPCGWVFSDSLLASLVLAADGGQWLQMLSPDTGWSRVILPSFFCNTLYLRARGLSPGVRLAACGDTVELDTTWQSYAFPVQERITISVSGGTGCLLDDAVQSFCPRVNTNVVGNTITCSIEGNYQYEYILYLTDPDGVEWGYHITESPFTIENLLPLTEYDVRWEYMYMDMSCVPSFHTATGAVPLPYCVNFENNNNILPGGWTVTERDGYDDVGAVGTSMVRFSAGTASWNYLVLPPMQQNDYLQISLYGNFTGNDLQIGHLAQGNDTGSFVADTVIPHDAMSPVGIYNFSLRNIGVQQIAFRYKGCCLQIQRLGVSEDPRLTFHIYSPSSLVIEADNDDSYLLGTNTADEWPSNRIHATTTNPVSANFGDYDLYVRQFGGSDDCNLTRHFVRPGTITLPYCDEVYFDAMGEFYKVLPEGSYYASFTYAYGRYSYQLSCGNRPTIFMLPYLSNSSVGNAKLSFDGRATVAGSTLEVGVMTDLLDSTSFVPITTITFASTDWERQHIDLSAYTGTARWIAFRARSGLFDGMLYVNRIRLDKCFLPPYVTLHVEDYTDVVVEADGDTTINGPVWIEYCPDGTSPGSGTLRHFDSLPARLSLAPNTSYTIIYYCSNDRQGCQNQYTISTLPLPLYAPSCTNFDNLPTGQAPEGWHAASGPSAVVNSTSHSPGRSLAVRGTIATPTIDADSLGEVAAGFWVKATQTGAYLIVGCMSDVGDLTTFHPLTLIVPRQIGVWEYHMVSFADAPANATHIAFRNASGTDANLFIDDLLLTRCAIHDLRILNFSNASITLGWQQLGTPDATIKVLDLSRSTTTQYDLSTLPPTHTLTIPIIPQHNYQITIYSDCPSEEMPCARPYTDTINIEVPAGGFGCIDPTDLDLPQAGYFSGTYANPYANRGAINFGPLQAESRHTVNTDTSARDPRTGGRLRTIPEGHSASVRLGNWLTNPLLPEAEGVIYSIFVDTLDFSLLLLQYAAVLQDPMHAPEDQPRFRLELLDTNFNLIDPLCTAADFIANRNLGWNEAPDNVLWKDWTTVGVDLTAYHGQQVYLRLTTYDCNEGSHYGYAYFTLECLLKNLRTENCGNADTNIFIAPAGFNYRWYTSTSSATLSTSQTLVIPATQSTTYLCDLSFISNPECSFTLSAFGGSRYPLARFDTLVSYSDCRINVQFINRSTVSADGINPVATTEPAESAHWDFGNGLSSDSYHGYASYDQPGTYLVTLIAGISDDHCQDTLVVPLTVDFPTHPRLDGPAQLCYYDLDTLRLYGATTANPLWHSASGHQFLPLSPDTYQVGDTVIAVVATDPYGCTATATHPLRVNPTYIRFDSLRLCTPELPFPYADTVFLPGTTVADYHQLGTTVMGCDSNFHLNLRVSATTPTTVFDTVLASICDNENYTFFGSSYNTPGEHFANHIDSLDLCDSLHSLMLDVRPTSAVDTFANACDRFDWYGTLYLADTVVSRLDTNIYLCDSTTTLHLFVHPTYDLNDSILVCHNQRYVYEGIDYEGPISFPAPHFSIHHCDSLVHVTLYPSNPLFPAPPVVSLDSLVWHPYDTLLLGCDPQPLYLLDTSISVQRTWSLWNIDNPADTLTSGLRNYTPTLDTTGIFGFQLITVSDEGCRDTVRNDTLLWVFPSPHASFSWSPDHLSMHNPEVRFYNQSSPEGVSFLWLVSKDLNGSAFDTLLDESPYYAWERAIEPGDYPVSLVAYWLHQGPDTLTVVCTDTATNPIAIVNTYLQFPNSVTPNGDGINDLWVVVNLLEIGEYSMNELWIYDRFGALVYHVENIHQLSDFWDPNQTNSPDGTYYYRFSAKNNFGLVKRNGVIEVSR